ncbi:MAG: YdiU family protein [Alphaproteobacteria bacterium]|nr:YdiU family protein [Alphaproteobacteria bacterium]MBV9692155.1 YdiU family protein [Alphaproteobacteria bacterium]
MPFSNSYARLPERFYAKLPPTPVAAPRLIKWNEGLARELGLAMLDVEVLAGNRVAEGSEPLAMAYAGHQFGNFVPQLGDGRAILLGEVVDAHGIRRDIHLKGSGPTPFSRRGDGRAALGPVLREYIVAEAMAALGIPTTRALAAVATGEMVWRETPLPGAVLARVASSHVRVGTFQYFAARADVEGLRALAEYVIARHYGDAAQAPNPYRALLDRVIAAQAALVAKWMGVGFIHGVMNTDNMSIAGETIDYGPCAFMDTYHPETVFSSIDEMGRYAYANQPRMAHWNLVRLAEALLPILGADEEAARAQAQAAIDAYPALFQAQMELVFRAKLGMRQARDGDMALVQDLLDRMAAEKADFTLTFRGLSDGALPPVFGEWAAGWRARLAEEGATPQDRREAMRAVNPAFIARNHRVEEALAAANENDFAPFETLLSVLSKPYDDQPEYAAYRDAPRPEQVVLRTFCGT